ncbi:MAG: transglutaminaseTgpA domain-containing protein [Cyanobacteriota bacterium]|jgi:transglutaminase-like putative cysteine protease
MSRWQTSALLQWLAVGLLTAGLLALRPVDLLSSLAMLITLLTGLKLWEARQVQERRLVCLLQLVSAGLQAAMQPDLAASLLQGTAVLVALAGLLALEMGSTAQWGVLMRRSVGVVLAALPLALVLFLLVPRLQPIGVFPGGWGAAAVTGLSDTLEPGSIASLATSSAPAARVSFASGSPPPPEARQWRVLVHEAFDGQRWTARTEDPTQELLGWRNAREGAGPLQQVWLSEPSPLERLPWSGAGSPSIRQLRVTTRGELVHRGPSGQRRAYAITAAAPQLVWQRERPGPDLLALPAGTNPRLEALGASWASGPPMDRLRRVEQWMRSQPFRYTRQPGLLPEKAPLDVFLFERRQGFCGHFASAFSALLRAAGLPARVVSGYQGGSWVQPVSGPGYLDLRQSHAHAWSEVWIEGLGWVSVDPSRWVSGAATGANPVAAEAKDPLQWLERQWWGLDLAWTRWWLGYDARSQDALLARLLGDRRDALGVVVLGAMALTLAGGLALLSWLRQRGEGDPQRRELDRCLMAFARQGWLPRAGETLPQLAARLRQRWPQLEPELGVFVSRYETQRFGQEGQRPGVRELRRSRRRLLRRWRQLTQVSGKEGS